MKRLRAIWLSLCVAALLYAGFQPTLAQTPAGALPALSADNAEQLRLQSVIPDLCGRYNADSTRMLVPTTEHSLTTYDTTTGSAAYTLTAAKPLTVDVSPDAQTFGISGSGDIDGLYAFQTGERLIAASGQRIVFSADSRYAAVLGDSVYDLTAQQRLFPLTADVTDAAFSPDDAGLMTDADMRDLPSGHGRFHIEGEPLRGILFSPDSQFFWASGAVYDARTGAVRFQTGAALQLDFSGNSRSLVTDRAIYNLETGDAVETPNGLGFSLTPDGMTLVSPGLHRTSGLIDLANGTTRMLPHAGIATISPNGAYALSDDGLIDLNSGAVVFLFPDGTPYHGSYSPDSSLFAGRDTVYRTSTGAEVFSASAKASIGPLWPLSPFTDALRQHQRVYTALVSETGAFSPDGTRLSVTLTNQALPQGYACLIFAASGGPRTGAVYAAAHVNVRQRPSTSALVAYSTPKAGSYTIVSTQGDWYQLADGNWISGDVAVPLYIPAILG